MKAAILRYKEWSLGGENKKLVKKWQSLQNLLDRVVEMDKPELEKRKVSLNIKHGERSGNDVVTVKNLHKSLGNKTLFNSADFHLCFKERAALLGKNGTGKSTLIKMLLGELEPDKGEIKLGASIKLAYLAQESSFADTSLTVLETFLKSHPMFEHEARNILARFLFTGESVFKTVEKLSGGEKIRLKLSMLLQQDINFLILDEPTNHLDIDSREMLENALLDFKGTILFISHDRYFINKIASEIVEISDKSLIKYNGNYDDYRENKNRNIQVEQPKIEKNRNSETLQALSHEAMKERRRREQKIESIENEIERLQQYIEEKETEISLCGNDYEKAAVLIGEKESFEQKSETLFKELLNIEDAEV